MSDQIQLADLGWSDSYAEAFARFKQDGFSVGRVSIENRNCYSVLSERGELIAEAAGRLLFTCEAAELPKVGDWVVLQESDGGDHAIIHEVLPRRTKFSRNVAGKRNAEQVIATNIDVIFVVQGLDHNFNLRRLERTLVMVNESAALPVIILNKSDLCSHVAQKIEQCRHIAPDIAIKAVSAKDGDGMEELGLLIKKNETIALIGSSGVGKSTIINRLVGQQIQPTQDVRSADSRGRHTTTRRQLIVLEQGGCLIDTPGMREFQLWRTDEGVTETFAEIEELARDCHFSDCSHMHEIKCSVLAALANGELAQQRYDSFIKLRAEQVYQVRRTEESRWQQHQKSRAQGKLYKQVIKYQKQRKKGR